MKNNMSCLLFRRKAVTCKLLHTLNGMTMIFRETAESLDHFRQLTPPLYTRVAFYAQLTACLATYGREKHRDEHFFTKRDST